MKIENNTTDSDDDKGQAKQRNKAYCCYFFSKGCIILLKAKFHYASWFGAGSEPASVMEFGTNQLRTCSEPAPN